ncbi:MAG: hypothetical protein ABI433_14770 [Burkholderiaceae bacterium]
MNHAKLILAAALVGLSSAAMADLNSDREQRMNDALENYRSSDASAKNPSPGPVARAENATKRGLRKAGDAIETTAKRTGEGVAAGAHKAGNAMRRTGEKIKEKTTPAQ